MTQLCDVHCAATTEGFSYMLGNLFDSPTHLLILIVVVVALFGWKKMPDAARSLGRSMRIFKSEINQMKRDDKPTASAASSDTQNKTHLITGDSIGVPALTRWARHTARGLHTHPDGPRGPAPRAPAPWP